MQKYKVNSLKKRFIVFLLINLVIVGVIGPSLLSSRLLNELYFSIYIILGNLALLWLSLFIVANRKKINILQVGDYKKRNLLFILLAIFLVIPFFVIKNMLAQFSFFSDNYLLSISAHIMLFSIPILIALGVFGYKFLRFFVVVFYKELAVSGIIAFLFTLALIQLTSAWLVLSNIALIGTKFLLNLTSISATIVPPTTLAMDNLWINVGQTCSGIESIFLFSLLYLLVSVFEWDNFNKKKIIILYIPSIVGLFIVNIFRIYLLIIISIFVSPSLSLQTLHTYLGLIFFVIYFALFWKLFYSWMKK